MAEKFSVYDYEDSLKSGQTLKIVRTVYAHADGLQKDIKATVQNVNRADLFKEKESLELEEIAAFASVKEATKKWVEVAKQLGFIKLVLEYINAPTIPTHTGNKWEIEDRGYNTAMHTISNMTYRMYFRIYTDIKRVDGEDKAVAWVVSWSFTTNSPCAKYNYGYNPTIAGQERKKFKSLESCMKYVEGRKKAYSKYFKELQPKILAEYENTFKVNGVLLEGYEVEGEE